MANSKSTERIQSLLKEYEPGGVSAWTNKRDGWYDVYKEIERDGYKGNVKGLKDAIVQTMSSNPRIRSKHGVYKRVIKAQPELFGLVPDSIGEVELSGWNQAMHELQQEGVVEKSERTLNLRASGGSKSYSSSLRLNLARTLKPARTTKKSSRRSLPLTQESINKRRV